MTAVKRIPGNSGIKMEKVALENEISRNTEVLKEGEKKQESGKFSRQLKCGVTRNSGISCKNGHFFFFFFLMLLFFLDIHDRREYFDIYTNLKHIL